MPDQRAIILSSAKDFVRRQVPYLFGGSSSTATDCSGLSQQVYRAAGIELGRTTWDQWDQGVEISEAEAEPGDLVFFDMSGQRNNHVGIFVSAGTMIDAPDENETVRMVAIYSAPHRFWRHPALDTTPDPAPASALQPGLCATVEASDGLNLRKVPGTTAPSWGLLPNGTAVLTGTSCTLADERTWREVAAFLDGKLRAGWVAEEYLGP